MDYNRPVKREHNSTPDMCVFCEKIQKDPYGEIVFKNQKIAIFEGKNKYKSIQKHFLGKIAKSNCIHCIISVKFYPIGIMLHFLINIHTFSNKILIQGGGAKNNTFKNDKIRKF